MADEEPDYEDCAGGPEDDEAYLEDDGPDDEDWDFDDHGLSLEEPADDYVYYNEDDDDETEEAFADYLDASRGFYPVVAMVETPGQSSRDQVPHGPGQGKAAPVPW